MGLYDIFLLLATAVGTLLADRLSYQETNHVTRLFDPTTSLKRGSLESPMGGSVDRDRHGVHARAR